MSEATNDNRIEREKPDPPEFRAGWFNLSLFFLVVLIVLASGS